MTSTANTNAATKVVTGMARLSYAHIWEPASIDGLSDKKYSVSVVIPKSDTRTVSAVKNAINAAADAGLASKFGGKRPANLKLPLRDGDAERPGDEVYRGCYFVNATSKTAPGIIDVNKLPILDSNEVYSGCYARVSMNFYAFNTSGNRGIACGLNHIQKLKDGVPLGGRGRAEDDFDDGFDISEFLNSDNDFLL